MSVWDILAIAPTNDLRAIKRAYAVKLKVTRPESDPQAYQELREAFDQAKRIAKNMVVDDTERESPGVEIISSPELTSEPEPASDLASESVAHHTVSLPDSDELNEPETETAALLVCESSDEELLQLGSTDKEQEPLLAIDDKQEEATISEQMDAQVGQMVQSIHDCLYAKGEVAAVALFHQCLESPELFSIDLSKRFDLQVMDYLGWWANKKVDDADVHLPLGFMRQIMNHYEWHKDGISMLQNYPALEQYYESIKNDCGINFLQKVKRKEFDYTADFPLAAGKLLGECKPKRFRLFSIVSDRRNAIYQLLARVEGMNDASFDFELNTDSVKWWRDAKEHYFFSGWMIGVGLFLAIFFTAIVGDAVVPHPELASAFAKPLVAISIFLFLAGLASCLVYWLAYGYKKIVEIVKQAFSKLKGVYVELVYLGGALLLFALANAFELYLFDVDQSQDAGIFYGFSAVLLTAIYRHRIIDILAAIVSVLIAFGLDGVGHIFDEIPAYQIICPVLIINTLLFYGYLDFKSKQLVRDFKLTEISKLMRICLGALLVATSFAYGLIVL